jgi:hypothetical protein
MHQPCVTAATRDAARCWMSGGAAFVAALRAAMRGDQLHGAVFVTRALMSQPLPGLLSTATTAALCLRWHSPQLRRQLPL